MPAPEPSAEFASAPGHPRPPINYQEVLRSRRAVLTDQLASILAEVRPLTLEIGCGHGHFLAAYAAAHPDQTCIGIDIAGDRIERATRKRDRAGLRHLHFLRVEAGLFLETLPAAVRFDRVFVLFPDPWPKLRHHKHRLLQPDFLRRLAGRAGEGTRLFFRTDYAPYFAEAAAMIDGDPLWQRTAEPWAFEFETVFQSRAEQHESLVAKLRGPVARPGCDPAAPL